MPGATEDDVTLMSHVRNIAALLLSLLFLWIVVKTLFRSLRKKCFAFFVNRLISPINKKLGNEKEQLFSHLKTLKTGSPNLTILEIGAGAGANFKYYPRGCSVICVEPNDYFQSYLENNASQFPHVNLKQFIVAKGEAMDDVPDKFCDAVVSTLVLCSVEDTAQVLKEVKRVLKPGGLFFFLEHIGYPPSSWLSTVQRLWKRVRGGKPKTAPWQFIEEAGFDVVEYKKFPLSTWFLPMKYILSGTATL